MVIKRWPGRLCTLQRPSTIFFCWADDGACGRFERLVKYVNTKDTNFEHLLQTTFLKYIAMHVHVSLYVLKHCKNEALTGGTFLKN